VVSKALTGSFRQSIEGKAEWQQKSRHKGSPFNWPAYPEGDTLEFALLTAFHIEDQKIPAVCQGFVRRKTPLRSFYIS